MTIECDRDRTNNYPGIYATIGNHMSIEFGMRKWMMPLKGSLQANGACADCTMLFTTIPTSTIGRECEWRYPHTDVKTGATIDSDCVPHGQAPRQTCTITDALNQRVE